MANARSRYADLMDSNENTGIAGPTPRGVQPAVQPVMRPPVQPGGTVNVGGFTLPANPRDPLHQPGTTTGTTNSQGWTDVWGPGPQGTDYQSWFMNLVGNRPWNQETLNNLMPVLSHYGFKLTPPNANGDQTKIQLPTGEWVRVGFGEGKPVWIPQHNAGGGTAGSGGFMGGAGGGNQWSALAGELGGPPPFEFPSMEQLQATPGYQARLDAGQQSLERSAAAKGSLLSGGFQKTLNHYSQDYASNEYQNAYNNYLSRYNTNVNTQSQLPWSRYQDLLGVGSGATGTLAGAGKVPLPQG